MIIDDLTLETELSRTPFRQICLATKKGSSIKYMAQIIDKQSNSSELAKKYLDNEISIVKDITHPNIAKLIDIIETEKYRCIVTEYCNGGSLENYLLKHQLENENGLSEEIVQHIMRQIINVMKYLYNKKIIHRDLKPENFLIQYEDENDRKNNNILKGTIKLIDFGLAKILKEGEYTKTALGSPLYMSPLILQKFKCQDKTIKDKVYDYEEDIWSLGILCYKLLIGKSPFDADNMDELVEKMEKGEYFMPFTLSKEAITFINSMLQYESKNRLSYDELKNHKFLKKNVNEFSKIEFNGVKNIATENDLQILFNTKSNESVKIFAEVDFKKLFNE